MNKILSHFEDFSKRSVAVAKEALNSLRDKDIFVVLVIILVAFASFGLGRLSKIEDSREPITVEDVPAGNTAAIPKTGQVSQTKEQVVSEKGTFVASKNGTKYYLPWCSGVSKINETNKVWFATKEEAIAAGLSPAANCPGI